MFQEGLILYYNDFRFKNGSDSKSKYFIVLKRIDSMLILATLPSSKDFVPSVWQDYDHHTCIELAEFNFNCFFIKPQSAVTTTGWGFPLPTFLYGSQIDAYDEAILYDIYPVEGIDYDIIGQLKPELLGLIKDCFRSSASVKRKFRRIL
ncbi:hypothetical protein [Emticicia sp. 21SJ11W-3]|uniref:hypothetical protein n=1 Tax=Emticicia sp. 21SJ11W-3 TaxID=2916755 RepID=UPI00209D557D|nr:hypothetical protein [Emticicia sp. 21SJ11W-3]UTA66617.1 hypothetical protein MB380_13505 [Emticicia sp. 21SJ11W-3]